jgi:hypothetical protein
MAPSPGYVVLNPLHADFHNVPKRPKVIVSERSGILEWHVLMCYEESRPIDAYLAQFESTRSNGRKKNRDP